MATRLYVDGVNATALAPSTWSAGWNKTTSTTNKTLGIQKQQGLTSSTALANTGDGTSGHFVAVTRFVSAPLAQQTIGGTLKGQVTCNEVAAGDNYTLATAVKVIKSDGTDRGVLLAVVASDNVAATPPEMATATTNRSILNSVESASHTLTSTEVSLGDRIVVESGFFAQSTSANNGTLTVRNDSLVSDAGENDTDAATVDSWVEFSQTLAFAIQHVGSSSVPVDGLAASGNADPTAITPFTMQTGDLVCMIGHQRAAAATLAITAAGGQTWTSETAVSTTNVTARLFWCVFNGTWSTDPSVDFTATICNSVHLHAFRPPATNSTWSVNVALAELDIAAAPHTITGQTTTGTDPTVTLAGWFTSDDNTWGTLTGTGWEVTGVAQYRNTAGTDQSGSYAHKIQTAAAATGNVTKSQLTLGDDLSTTFIITFAATQGGLPSLVMPPPVPPQSSRL